MEVTVPKKSTIVDIATNHIVSLADVEAQERRRLSCVLVCCSSIRSDPAAAEEEGDDDDDDEDRSNVPVWSFTIHSILGIINILCTTTSWLVGFVDFTPPQDQEQSNDELTAEAFVIETTVLSRL